MLVLQRLVGESVMVGDAKVTVASVRGNKVRLGFEFPKNVQVDRLEVYNAKKRKELADDQKV